MPQQQRKNEDNAGTACKKQRDHSLVSDSVQRLDSGVESVNPISGLPPSSQAALLINAGSTEHRSGLAMQLQHSHGNAYVQALLSSKAVQAKLTISQPDDASEREADVVAGLVTEKVNSPVQRQEEEEEEIQTKVQRKKEGEEVEMLNSANLETRIDSARDGGQPLNKTTRSVLEPHFGQDFSNVRIHTDGNSDNLNRELKAEAFTTGRDIFFKSGNYNPDSRVGQWLLAHELTHVVQQSGDRTESASPGEVQHFSRKPAIQRNIPSEEEVEGSMIRAGVQAEFPPIWAMLMEEADRRGYLSWEEWLRITSNQSEAERLFSSALGQVWGRIRSEFLTYLIGSAGSSIVGLVLRVLPAFQRIIDEGNWRRSRDYRVNQIYLWLLRQLALSCASAERDYEVTEWDSRVQQIYTMLISQTVDYQQWMESDEAREFARRAAEARGGRPEIRSR